MGNDNNDVNQRDIDNLAYKIEDVKKDIEKHTDSIDELNRRIQQVEKEHIKMSGKLDVITAESANISSKIDELSADIKEDRISRESETGRINDKLGNVVEDVNILTNDSKRGRLTNADKIAIVAISITLLSGLAQIIMNFMH